MKIYWIIFLFDEIRQVDLSHLKRLNDGILFLRSSKIGSDIVNQEMEV